MIEITRAADVTVVKVDGDLAGSNAEQFRNLVKECLQQGRRDFIVDLAGAEGCDSAGLEALTWLHRECEDRLGLVRLCALSDVFRKILEITRLNHRFEDVYDTF